MKSKAPFVASVFENKIFCIYSIVKIQPIYRGPTKTARIMVVQTCTIFFNFLETFYLDKNVTFNHGLKNCEAMKSGEVRVAGPDQITEDTLKRSLYFFQLSVYA